MVATGAATAVWLRVGPLPAGLLDESREPVHDRRRPTRRAVVRGAVRRADTRHAARARRLAADARRGDHRSRGPALLSPPRRRSRCRSRARCKANLVEGAVVEGGSTITQQVAKLLLNRLEPGRARGVAAKMREAVVALRLEHRFTKRETPRPVSEPRAVRQSDTSASSEPAAPTSACRASLLTPAQAAFLAGLPQRPSGFNPYRNRDAAIRRQRPCFAAWALPGAHR